MPAPAQAPRSIRAVDPEFMQSSACAGSATGPGCMTRVSPSLSIRTPSDERGARGLDVATGIQIGDNERLVAPSTGDERPMGDGLVPGNAHASAQTAGLKGHQKESLSIS